MRLIRYGEKGKENPGLLKDGKIVNLRRIFPEIPDISETFFRDGWMEKLAKVSDSGQEMDVRLGCPILHPSKLICLGINYLEHKQETGFEKPANPLLFCKTPNTLNGPLDPILLPHSSKQVDWEVELAVVIGKKAKYLDESDALGHVAGYLLHNDYSEREFQLERGGQWVKGKSADTFAPLGPFLATRDEIADPGNLHLWLRVNGKTMQDGHTSNMAFRVSYLVSYLSRFMTLLPGDIVSTGTPAGVGLGLDPPAYLKPGDVVELGIDGLGQARQEVVKEEGS